MIPTKHYHRWASIIVLPFGRSSRLRSNGMRHGLTFLLTFAVGIFLVPSHDKYIEKPRDTEGEMIAASIGEFWKLSQEADGYLTSSIVSGPPEDYYKMVNLCEAKADDATSHGAGSSASISNPELPRTLDPMDKQFIEASVRDFARTLRDSNSRRFRITDIRISGTHAAVRGLQYGKEGNFTDHVYFLLTKSEGVWKIFMIDRGSYFSFDNKYFGQTECSETPLTDLPWKGGM